MTRGVNQETLVTHLEAERGYDMDATLATLHPECRFVDDQLGMRLSGRDGARRHYELWWSAFGATPDDGLLHWVDDDLAVGEACFVGVHVGLFAGSTPTGRSIRVPFVVFVTFRDGLLVSRQAASPRIRRPGTPLVSVLGGLAAGACWPVAGTTTRCQAARSRSAA